MRIEKHNKTFTPTPIYIVAVKLKKTFKTTLAGFQNAQPKCKLVWGFTLVELIIAMALIVIIFSAIVPPFRAIRNSWATNEASSTIIQNGMVLDEHINRNLSAAKQIVSVSSSSDVNGFIIFKDPCDIQKRYMVSGGYVVFGTVGSEEQLAGPVSRFQVSSYLIDSSIGSTTLPTTDANHIRLVKVDTDFTNSDALGTNKTFTAYAYLRSNTNNGLVGWWKLDENSGTTAADSSGSGNNGTLQGTILPTWGAGQIGNALTLNGVNDHVTLPIGSVINSLTNCTIATWVNWSGGSSSQHIFDFGTGTTYYMYLTPGNSANQMCFAITKTGSAGEEQTTYTAALPSGGWHHVAVTIDAYNHIDKLYLDGNSVAQKTSANLKPSDLGTTTNNYLGRSQNSANPYFNGKLDDVRIYGRVLTDANIAQLANTLRYIGFIPAKQGSDTTSITISTPATNTGDLLIAAVATDGDTSTTISTPAGWTQIDRGTDNSSQVTLGAWYKVAGTLESAPIFNWTGGQQAYGWMMQFRGNDSTKPIDACSTASETSITPTSPAVNTTVNNCIILRLGAFDDNNITVGNPGLTSPLHTAITMDASGSSAGTGPVAILGSWQTGTTHAKETAGSNRALVFIAHSKPGNNPTLTAVSYGGQSMTKITEFEGGNGSNRVYTAAFILNDAGITAATTTTFSPTWSGTPSSVAYSSVFLQNVNQTDMRGATAGNTTSTGATITTSALANTSGDMVIDAAICNNTGTYTVDNAFTKALDITMSGASGVDGYKSAAGTSLTPSVTHSTSYDRQSLIGFVVKTAGGPGTVSGGAGYVKQSTAGLSSGTPTFQLTASNEARMLTIGIAPAPASTSLDDQIKP